MKSEINVDGKKWHCSGLEIIVSIVTVLLLNAAGILSLETPANAALFEVATPAQLQTALTTAQTNGEDDTINLAAATYTITAPLEYTPTESHSLTLKGADRDTTIIDGGDTIQIFRSMINGFSNAHLTIKNISFQNGSANLAGALMIGSNSGNVIVENSKFIDSSANGGGGVVFEITNGDLVFNDNIVSGNQADTIYGGAALISYDGTLTVTGNRFAENTAVENGAGVVVLSENGSINFSRNTVTRNSISATTAGEGRYAGAYLSTLTGPITFHNNTVSDNSVTGATPFGDDGGISGGVTIVSGEGAISINGNRINGNTANNYEGGGAAQTESGDIIFTNNLVYDNTATGGGGGFALISSTGTIYAINNTIYHNTAVINLCGGLYIQPQENNTDTAFASAYIYNNIVWGNSAGGVGDDIYINDNEDSDAFRAEVHLHYNNFTDLHIVDGGAFSADNNMDQDPQLTADFHIPAGSPCIDAGDGSAPEVPAEDMDSNNRIIDGDGDGVSAVDIGADEYTVAAAGRGGGGGGGGCFLDLLAF